MIAGLRQRIADAMGDGPVLAGIREEDVGQRLVSLRGLAGHRANRSG
jgi:hypothetical protein